jgi:drug/metabolite transporter (DMT)-like permease
MPLFGVALALLSAGVWGSGDFLGGIAARRAHAVHVLLVAALSGVILLSLLAWLSGEGWPDASAPSSAAGAGCAGALGIAALYRGLAGGSAAAVAPIAAVLTASVPVLVNSVVVGPPSWLQCGGFVLALVGIWLVAGASPGQTADRASLLLAVAAGLGFGVFLVLIAHVGRDAAFGGLAVARGVTVAVAAMLTLMVRAPWPSRSAYPIALAAGTLDAGGNALYVLAAHYMRLDLAAVLSSLYPLATVALAWLVDRQIISGWQWAGAVSCLGAVLLITM